MAEDTRQANVVLTADTSQYSQQMASASAQTNQAATAVDKLVNAMDRLQRSVSRKLDIISAVSIGGITAATLAAAKFETQMASLHATAAITGKNFNLVEKSVDDLRRTLPTSTEQIVQLVNALQKMGVSTPKVKELAEVFIKLGAATGEDVGSLTTGLVGLQRAMGTTEGSIKSFADETAHLSATLGVSATGILQFSQQLAPVARAVGMTQTEVMGFSTAFVKAGQDGYAAANVFNKMLTDISRATRYGSSDIYAYANAVGMTADAFKKLPAVDQISQLLNAINRQGPEGIRTLEQLGYEGPRTMKAIQGFIQSGGLSKAMTEANKGFTSGATDTGAGAAMKGLNESLKELQNTLTSIGQAFGKSFLPWVTKAVDAVNMLARGIRALMDPLEHMLSKFALIGAAVSGVASVASSGIGILAAAGGAYALLRNPLTAGFMSRRAERTGAPMSRFTENTANNMSTRGTPFQRMLFGWGQRGANFVTTDNPEMGPRISPWRRAAAAARASMAETVQAAANYTTPRPYMSNEPLLPGQRNAEGGRRYPWTGIRFGRPDAGADLLPERPAMETFQRGLHLQNIPGRVAMGVSGLFQGALGTVRSQIDPLRWGGTMDATARPGYQWKETGDTLRRAWTGEGAGIGKAVTGAQTAIVRFGRATADAAAGLGRLTAAAGRAAIGSGVRGAVSNIKGLASGAVSMLGGPIGIATMAGFAGLSLATTANQTRDSFRERLGADGAADSAVNKYASAMGLAATAAMSFADTVNSAAKAIDVPTAAEAKQITQQDVAAASMRGREYADPALKKMNEQQAAAYAMSVYGRSDTDPKIMQAMKLDLLQRFNGNQQTVNDIIGAASGQTVNGMLPPQLGDLLKNYTEANSPFGSNKGTNGNFFTDGFKAGKPMEDSLAQIVDSYKTMAQYTTTQFGQGETDKLTSAVMNQIIGKFSKNQTLTQGVALAGSLEDLSGIDNLKLGAGDIASIQNANGDYAKQQVFYNAVAKSGNGQPLLDMRQRLGDYDAAAVAYTAPPQGKTADLYTKMGLYNTQAGGLFSQDTPLGKELRDALSQPENKNLVLKAGEDLAAKLRELTGSVAGADAAMQQIKGTVNNPNDPMYQIAGLGQQQAARIGAIELGGGSSVANARQALLGVTAAQSFTGDDAAERRQAQEDSYNQQYTALHQQLTQMMKAYQDFDIQRSRSEENFNIQRERGEYEYNLQRQYQEEDYQKQKARAQEQYDITRRRSEEDYQHQVEEQIKQTAQTIQSTYERITTKATWDAKNLLVNAADQMQRMQQQQADLATVRGMGLSGDVIQNLGLNDFQNQQQLARMVGDFATNPELIQQFNDSIQGKLDISKAFVMDPDSEAWKESQYSFQRGMAQMAEDKERINKQGEADYNETLARQKEAHDRAMKQTFEDFNRQMKQAADDMNRSFEDLTTDFNTTAANVLSKLTGTTKTQYEQLIGALSQSKSAISGALTDTNSEVIKQLAPLFGGEEAARKALENAADAQQSNHAPGGQFSGSSGIKNPALGGPHGSEYSYDSMSAGSGMGGAGGADFPLPAGSWHKTSGFGMRMNPVLHRMMLHAGTDLAARPGTPIGAAEDGIVTKAQQMGGLGNMVEVSHGDGTKTWYGHMSMITSKVGQMVSAGEQIGLVGSTGNSTGPHLHFERHINGQAVDPWSFLQGLENGQITGPAAGAMGLSMSGTAPDITKLQGVMNAEKAFSTMVPGGMAYTPGMFTNALQTRVSGLGGAMAMDGGVGGDSNLSSYYGGSRVRTGGGGGYVRSGVSMGTSSVTTIQHIDQGTDYNGGIVVVAQDPDEMGRKLAEKKRMKALTRPSRGNG